MQIALFIAILFFMFRFVFLASFTPSLCHSPFLTLVGSYCAFCATSNCSWRNAWPCRGNESV